MSEPTTFFRALAERIVKGNPVKAATFDEALAKYNPNHDTLGRFASGHGFHGAGGAAARMAPRANPGGKARGVTGGVAGGEGARGSVGHTQHRLAGLSGNVQEIGHRRFADKVDADAAVATLNRTMTGTFTMHHRSGAVKRDADVTVVGWVKHNHSLNPMRDDDPTANRPTPVFAVTNPSGDTLKFINTMDGPRRAIPTEHGFRIERLQDEGFSKEDRRFLQDRPETADSHVFQWVKASPSQTQAHTRMSASGQLTENGSLGSVFHNPVMAADGHVAYVRSRFADERTEALHIETAYAAAHDAVKRAVAQQRTVVPAEVVAHALAAHAKSRADAGSTEQTESYAERAGTLAIHESLQNLQRHALARAELQSVDHYFSNGYEEVNAALRGERPMDTATRDIVRHLDRAVSKVPPTSHDVEVARSLYINPKTLAVGSVVMHHNFASSTVDTFTANGFGPVTFHFIVPKGTKAIVSNPGEGEVLLPRGVGLKVVSMKEDNNRNGFPRMHVTAELILPPKTPPLKAAAKQTLTSKPRAAKKPKVAAVDDGSPSPVTIEPHVVAQLKAGLSGKKALAVHSVATKLTAMAKKKGTAAAHQAAAEAHQKAYMALMDSQHLTDSAVDIAYGHVNLMEWHAAGASNLAKMPPKAKAKTKGKSPKPKAIKQPLEPDLTTDGFKTAIASQHQSVLAEHNKALLATAGAKKAGTYAAHKEAAKQHFNASAELYHLANHGPHHLSAAAAEVAQYHDQMVHYHEQVAHSPSKATTPTKATKPKGFLAAMQTYAPPGTKPKVFGEADTDAVAAHKKAGKLTAKALKTGKAADHKAAAKAHEDALFAATNVKLGQSHGNWFDYHAWAAGVGGDEVPKPKSYPVIASEKKKKKLAKSFDEVLIAKVIP